MPPATHVIDSGDTAWLLISTALVMLMTPGLALFYGGMVQRKNVLSTFMHCFFALGIVTIQWAVIGYSLAFGQTHGGFIGGLEYAFMKGVGGSSFHAVQTQYCRGIAAGSVTCAGDPNADYITNPKSQYKSTWIDPTPVPDAIIGSGLAENLVDDPIATEAVRAAAHFGDYNPNAVFIIMTPPRPVATGQPAYCGYHTQTTSLDGLGNPARIQYAFIPWQNTDWPGIGQGCGLHAVNAKSNSFGNGIFDSWSIVVGHEYEEAVTDPDNFFAVQDGWNDAQTSENSDKCAWTKLKNAKFGSHVFAVQPNWSNRDFDAGGDGCPTPY